MPGILNVYTLPKLVEPEELLGGTVVVIDVLRSTTTIVHALAAGAREVIPCAEVAEARKIASRFPPDQVVLGGERGGLAVKGFDLGNSPQDYTPDRVCGKTIVITTTNGTRAMAHAQTASQILLGAFVNVSALCKQLRTCQAIHVLCSGTDGQSSDDDTLVAGMLVDRLQRGDGLGYMLNAQAIAAEEMWLHTFALPLALGAETLEPERLAEALYGTPGGRNLAALGLDDDILVASQIDRFAIVPMLDPVTFRIEGQ
ncbi:MAG: 2-phosphosulfolactate phosphatase [Thermoguttaceae bacterium]